MNTPQKTEERNLFGFWLYILSDCVLFAGLFATFAVLRGATFGGPTGEDLLRLPFVLLETLILLSSSYAMGLSLVAAQLRKKKATLLLLGVALALGFVFLGLELSEFRGLILAGTGPSRSAFLSAFFTLVGTHGLHVFLGSLWMILLMVQVYIRDLSDTNLRRLRMLGLFWHFLDIVWIFIFSIVYLLSSAL